MGHPQWNGDSVVDKGLFSNKVPIVITDETQTSNTGPIRAPNGYSGYIPFHTVGAVGDYAVIATTTLNRIFTETLPGNWVLVGSDPGKKLAQQLKVQLQSH